jgi:hypothetical protein
MPSLHPIRVLISAFGLAALSQSAVAQCPTGPFLCIPWGPPPGVPTTSPPTPAPAPPGPFMPSPITELKPLQGSSDRIPELLRSYDNISRPTATEKKALQEHLGDRTKLLNSTSYYFAPKPGGGGVAFKGSDLKK